MSARSDVAIVGMACLFPGAPDLATFAKNLEDGVDAIGDVPPGRLDPAFFLGSGAGPGDVGFYCRRGGFVDDHAVVDPAALGVMPRAAHAMEPDQLLALDIAKRAAADAGLDRAPIDRSRVGVILGKGNYAGPGRARLTDHVRGAEQMLRALRQLVPSISEADLARVKDELRAQAAAAGPDAALGLVPNLAASRIAASLDLGGPAYTVDAACASALIAVDQAIAELRAGRLDAVIAGGVHFCQDEAFWSVFTQLGAVSRSAQIRPFDRRADGVLLGEGAGLVVLKRRADAEVAGDRVYAIIKGTGVSSDGRGSLGAPKALGQVLAVERAWRDAGLDPASVGLVEAHGTATLAGDSAELETLRRVFGSAANGNRAVLGSVKSMIGHAMPAAGAAGLIKAALAVHQGTLLPTLHCEEPNAAVAATRFRTTGRAEPWTARTRRAGVSAFGFGGINGHLVLENVDAVADATGTAVQVPAAITDAVKAPRVLALAAATPADLDALIATYASRPEALAAPVVRDGEGSARLVVLDATVERLAKARTIVGRGASWRGRDNMFFEPVATGGDIVFAFPGVDASFRPRLTDVAARLGRTLPPELTAGSSDIGNVGAGLIEAGRLLDHALAGLGIRPDSACGHSVGEWSAMVATGLLDYGEIVPWLAGARAGAIEVMGVAFAAAGCGVEKAAAAMDGLPDIAVSHDNCPHQVILCGVDASIDEAITRLRNAGVMCQKLPFRSGFHSPLFAPHLATHRTNFATFSVHPPSVPLWSATSCDVMPSDVTACRELALRHLVEPVRFRELVLAMFASGARTFIQVGPGSLVGFIDDTLKGKGAVAITANAPEKSGMEQLARVAATVFCTGREPTFAWLHGDAPGIGQPAAPARPTPSPRPTNGLKLSLGVPLARFERPITLPQTVVQVPVAAAGTVAPIAGIAQTGPFGAQLDDTFAAMQKASADILAALAAPRTITAPVAVTAPAAVTAPVAVAAQVAAAATATAPATTTRIRKLSVETHPWLLDHALVRQPKTWPVAADRHPVVPLTTIIHFLCEEAAAKTGRIAVAVEDLRAFRWMAIHYPTDVRFELEPIDADHIRVRALGYAEATVVLADAYPAAPAWSPGPFTNPRGCVVTGENVYKHHWMFHGPDFQGIRTVDVVADDGILGTLETGATPGALLDNAGQLLGLHVMLENDRDRLAMPVGIRRITFHGPHPAAGDMVTCDVRLSVFDDTRVIADLALLRADGTAWCTIDRWEDLRFHTDANLWNLFMWPGRCSLGDVIEPGGPILVRDVYTASRTREQLYRHYLGEHERKAHDAMLPRAQRPWLAGRMAAKDAVRHLLWRGGTGELFPVELSIDNDATGRPLVRTPGGEDVRISLAHKDNLGVAHAAIGHDVGVDIERIEARDEAFASTAFSAAERALIGPGDDAAEWMTRLWAAKEAAGKRLGTGLDGNPRKLPVTDRTGARLLCAGIWVETRRLGDHVIAWTKAP
jgi:acyl transferase domain-containing protein/phosphopantetheinyl transferase